MNVQTHLKYASELRFAIRDMQGASGSFCGQCRISTNEGAQEERWFGFAQRRNHVAECKQPGVDVDAFSKAHARVARFGHPLGAC